MNAYRSLYESLITPQIYSMAVQLTSNTELKSEIEVVLFLVEIFYMILNAFPTTQALLSVMEECSVTSLKLCPPAFGSQPGIDSTT